MSEFFALLLEREVLIGLGVLSGILSFVCFLPYISDTLRGVTQPHRASWLIWSLLSSISLISQIHEGATVSLGFSGVQVAGTVVVFLLSIRRGMGHYLSVRNLIIFAVATGGLVAWYVTDNSVYALAISISISFLAGIPTILKSYAKPQSETVSKWALAFLSALLAILSVGRVDWVLMAYPLYLVVLYIGILGAIFLGNMRLRRQARQQRMRWDAPQPDRGWQTAVVAIPVEPEHFLYDRNEEERGSDGGSSSCNLQAGVMTLR